MFAEREREYARARVVEFFSVWTRRGEAEVTSHGEVKLAAGRQQQWIAMDSNSGH